MLVLIGGNIAQRAVSRLGAALAQVAGNGRNHGPLHRRVSIDFRTGDDVLCVPVVTLVIDELTGVAQNRGRGQPGFILRRQLVQGLQVVEELQRMCAYRL